MLDDKTKERIAKQSEDWYLPCGGCGARKPIERCIGCFHPFGQGKVDAYIAGAEAEAERNSGLVECLREMENHPMTAHYVKTKITHTLNQYNKP